MGTTILNTPAAAAHGRSTHKLQHCDRERRFS